MGTKKYVLVFPGQGAQYVGMANTLVEKVPNAAVYLDKANDGLGFDLAEIMRSGTAEDLQQTKVTQNAIFVYSLICLQALQAKGVEALAVAGHSLGEFTSLVAAGVIDFEDALRLVDLRARAMQKACELRPSTMAAVLGLADEKVSEICASVEGETVVPANFNCPGQVVISGSLEGIQKAQELLKTAGAKRVLPLAVGGAFHSPLMQPAQEELKQAILGVSFRRPLVPIYQNVTAQPVLDESEIKRNLIEQLTGSVRWTQTIQQMAKDGLHDFIEVGPGKVLQGLIVKIHPEAQTHSWGEVLFN